MRLLLILLLLAGPVSARGEKPGDFDYYVLALSWSPNWCSLEGRDRGSPQCDVGADFGWVLHGLWPQFERGWPSNCPSPHAPPSRGQTRDMAWLYGSSGSAWHQWRKHGVCDGRDPTAFYALSQRAYDSVTRPPVFRQIPRDLQISASVIEEAFLKSNPGLRADGVTITCKAGAIQEARICLTRDLEPRRCGADVIRDCTLRDAVFEKID